MELHLPRSPPHSIAGRISVCCGRIGPWTYLRHGERPAGRRSGAGGRVDEDLKKFPHSKVPFRRLMLHPVWMSCWMPTTFP